MEGAERKGRRKDKAMSPSERQTKTIETPSHHASPSRPSSITKAFSILQLEASAPQASWCDAPALHQQHHSISYQTPEKSYETQLVPQTLPHPNQPKPQPPGSVRGQRANNLASYDLQVTGNIHHQLRWPNHGAYGRRHSPQKKKKKEQSIPDLPPIRRSAQRACHAT